MRKRYAILLISFMLAACGIPANGPSIHTITPNSVRQETRTNKKIIHITSGEWIPYTGEMLPGYGCDSRVVTEVFAQLGYSVVYGFFPWARAMHFAEIGEWDGTLDWGDTPAFREKFFINSTPISEQEFVFVYRKDKPLEWNVLDDLEGKVIGITSGYVYGDIFNSQIEKGNLKFVEASSDEANFKKLLSGRIDIFPIERNVGLALLKSRFTLEERNQLQFDPRLLALFHPHLLLTKTNAKNEQVIQLFDAKLDEFKKSSGFSEIMNSCLN